MHALRVTFLPLLVQAVSCFASQYPLNSKFATYNTGLLNQVEDIRTLSVNEYTTLAHPAHPQYSVRIKQNGAESCDNSVKSYTGYIDIQARHLFFSFFESRNDPSQDDVILWTNGGPGCSSSLGLYMELGPCRINSVNSTTPNPYSWNEKANIFFIDQPVGVGFSYAEYGEHVSTSEEAAIDISAFSRIFFDTFTQFKSRRFHLAGESYGGRYIPTFGAQIADDNKKAIQSGLEPINLVSLMIGNGITDAPRMAMTYYNIQCTAASVQPFQDVKDCVQMKKAIPRCEAWLKTSCVDSYDEMNCRAAVGFCESQFTDPFFKTGRNIYDVSKDCEGDIAETLCYPITKTITNYLNQAEVRSQLGVDPSVKNFSTCSNKVNFDFNEAFDIFAQHTQYYVAELLERGVKVLIYVGAYDMICNWVGNEQFTLNLQWSGQKDFVKQELRDWIVDDHKAGRTRSYGGLTFATVDGAGHMVPYDKPVEALALVSRWLGGEEL